MLIIPMNKYREHIVETLSQLIAKKSVKSAPSLNMPYGKGVFSALIYMLDLAERLDLESYNLFGHMGMVTYGKGEETLAILTHLDVVPAGDGWDTDPFAAVEKDGKLYGRGTVDNKGAAIASLFALYALKESCTTLNKKVVLLFGCDEESGWADIDFYKENYEIPDYVISPDASFPIFNSEKGLLHFDLNMPITTYGSIKDIKSGSRVNIVPAIAEAVIKADEQTVKDIVCESNGAKMSFLEQCGLYTVTSEGIPAHGAHPEIGLNALTRLIRALRQADLTMGDVEKFIFTLDDLIGLEIDGKTLSIACSDEISGALSVNLGAVSINDGVINAKVDIRTPISADIESIEQKLAAMFKEKGIEMSLIHKQPPHHVDENNIVVQALKKVYKEYKGEEAECCCCAGATYARAFGNGVAFGPVDPGKDECEHGPNENIEIDDVIKLAEMLAAVIVEIAGSPDANII